MASTFLSFHSYHTCYTRLRLQDIIKFTTDLPFIKIGDVPLDINKYWYTYRKLSVRQIQMEGGWCIGFWGAQKAQSYFRRNANNATPDPQTGTHLGGNYIVENCNN